MSRAKRIFLKIIRPPVYLVLILTLICTAALLYVFTQGQKQAAFAYPVYVISAYTLFLLVKQSVNIIKAIRQAILAHPAGRRYMTDPVLRGHISLNVSVLINGGYAIFKLGVAIYYRSFWFGAIAVYYLVLAVTRALLLRSIRHKGADIQSEYKAARLCGYLLFAVTLALLGITIQMVSDGKGYTYPGTLIFAMAFYTFYAVGMAIGNLIRFRKLPSPVLAASKVLGLAVAIVSLLSLQTAMFASFGAEFQFTQLMNTLTGAGVCLIIFVMAILVIVRANYKLKKSNTY